MEGSLRDGYVAVPNYTAVGFTQQILFSMQIKSQH